jgi:hypothetical protein
MFTIDFSNVPFIRTYVSYRSEDKLQQPYISNLIDQKELNSFVRSKIEEMEYILTQLPERYIWHSAILGEEERAQNQLRNLIWTLKHLKDLVRD